MTKKRALLLVVALAAVAAVVVLALRQRTPPTLPVAYVPQTWQVARSSPMHAAHVGRKQIACTECHDPGFEKRPGEDVCVRCHAEPAKHAHTGKGERATPCGTCHVFRGETQVTPCVTCHDKLAKHASPDLACTACHDLHGEEKRVTLVDCTRCHGSASARHGRMSVAPLDGGGEVARSFEDDGGALRAAAPAPSASFDVAHATAGQVCAACHAPHTIGAKAKEGCEGCHAAPAGGAALASVAPRIEPSRAGPRVAGHEACTTCHDPHRATKDAVRACDGCHGTKRAAAEVKGHAICTGCHAPHTPSAAPAACGGCHAGVAALAAAKVEKHASCTSCHAPHEPKKPAATACASCHAGVSSNHPAQKGGACVGCHEPHPKKKEIVAAACSSCHTKAKSENAFHAKNVACAACHRPHAELALAGAGSAFCARCHDNPAKAVRTGHAECRKCHGEPHAPAKKPACSTCHGTEAATAPKGHATCTSCHEAHSGGLGKNADCATCHTDKPKALHGAIANGCGNCHRPHGPKGPDKPPACTTCHDASKLPGLHSVAQHAASCGSCHVAHGSPRSDRATCTTSCHVNRRDHQPDATVCKGCHMFRR